MHIQSLTGSLGLSVDHWAYHSLNNSLQQLLTGGSIVIAMKVFLCRLHDNTGLGVRTVYLLSDITDDDLTPCNKDIVIRIQFISEVDT